MKVPAFWLSMPMVIADLGKFKDIDNIPSYITYVT